MINSWFPDRQRSKMPRSTVAPRLSVLEMKQNCLVITTIRMMVVMVIIVIMMAMMVVMVMMKMTVVRV